MDEDIRARLHEALQKHKAERQMLRYAGPEHRLLVAGTQDHPVDTRHTEEQRQQRDQGFGY